MMVLAMSITVGADPWGQRVDGELFCLQALFPDGNLEEDPFYAFKTSTDPDTMYMHQAMKEPDREQFKEAMEKEVKDQMDNGNFIVVKRSSVPADQPVMPTVWQMKRKRDILTRKIKKWKARLNIDGSKMVKGVHYEESYSPVATWNSIRPARLSSSIAPSSRIGVTSATILPWNMQCLREGQEESSPYYLAR